MNASQSNKELRLKGSSSILKYIRQFSATEKVVFGVLCLIAAITALIMAVQAKNHFMTEIPAAGGTLREGVIGLPRTINPILAVTEVDRDMVSLVYAGLMRTSADGVIPDLARSYTISPDGLTYDFTLRSDLTFHDGKPLTADDVVFTVQKIQDPALKSPRYSDWANVTVKAISPTEVQFVLKQAYAPFLSNTTVGIIPKHIWGSVPDEQFIFSQYNIEPVGSGPYTADSVTRDSGGIPTEYDLSAWNKYAGSKAYISQIVFQFFSDEDAALHALDAGAIDSLASVPSDAARLLASNSASPYRVLSSPLSRIFGVFFNQNQNPVLADKTVRQALNMSVNRTAIINSVLDGYGIPIDGPLPIATTSSYTATTSNATTSPAQALLEKAGWKKNPDTGIYEKKPAKGSKSASQVLAFDMYTADTPELKAAAESVKHDWTALGAQVNLKVFESSDLYQNVIRTRKYDALLFGEQIGKDRDLYAFWHSSQRNAPHLNVTLYTNSKADKLLDDIRTTNDETVRATKYQQFSELIRSDIPAIFLYSPDFIYAVPKSLRNIKIDSIGVASDRWNNVNTWYMNTEKVWNIFSKN